MTMLNSLKSPPPKSDNWLFQGSINQPSHFAVIAPQNDKEPEGEAHYLCAITETQSNRLKRKAGWLVSLPIEDSERRMNSEQNTVLPLCPGFTRQGGQLESLGSTQEDPQSSLELGWEVSQRSGQGRVKWHS